MAMLNSPCIKMSVKTRNNLKAGMSFLEANSSLCTDSLSTGLSLTSPELGSIPTASSVSETTESTKDRSLTLAA